MSVRRTTRIEPYAFNQDGTVHSWCLYEFTRSDDDLIRTKAVVPNSLHRTRDEVADWLAARHREARA